MERADLLIKYCVDGLDELREEMVLQTSQMHTALKALQQAQAAAAFKAGATSRSDAPMNINSAKAAMNARAVNMKSKKLSFVESALQFMNNGPAAAVEEAVISA